MRKRNVDFYYLWIIVKYFGRKLLILDNIDWYNIDILFRMLLLFGKEMFWVDVLSFINWKCKWFYESVKKFFFRNVIGFLFSCFWVYMIFELF